MSCAYFLLVLLAVAFARKAHEFNCNDYETVYLAVDEELTNNPHIIPTIVRLAFHDCVGESCDGCLNFDDPHNAGLYNVFLVLEKIYNDNEFDKLLNRADYWQLAANVALVRGGMNKECPVKPCVFFDLQYRYGRKACASTPVHDGPDDAGDGHGDFKEVRRVLGGNFGLNDKEIVTLLGAHSLGGAHRQNSGFRYNWQEDFLTFDNGYYNNMLNLRFKQEDAVTDSEALNPADVGADVGIQAVGTTKKQKEAPHWEFASTGKKTQDPFAPLVEGLGDAEILMLNTDMSISKELSGVKDDQGKFTGRVKCFSERYDHKIWIDPGVIGQVATCKDAATSTIAQDYADNLDHFYHDFPIVWDKMNAHGCDNLKEPRSSHGSCGYCIPQGAYCVPGFEKAGSCCSGLKCEDYACRQKTQTEEDWYHYSN